MANDFQIWISRALLDIAKTTVDLQSQLNKITTLSVKVKAQIDQSQLTHLQGQTEKVKQGFDKIGKSTTKVSDGSKKINQSLQQSNKHLAANSHQWNKIATQMGVVDQFVIAMNFSWPYIAIYR